MIFDLRSPRNDVLGCCGLVAFNTSFDRPALTAFHYLPGKRNTMRRGIVDRAAVLRVSLAKSIILVVARPTGGLMTFQKLTLW